MEHTGIETYSPDWFKKRQGTFTASEAWKLMTEPRSKKDLISKTSETYILEKVHEKLTGMTKIGIDNFATEWGIEHEPMACDWYKRLTGADVQPSYLFFDKDLKNFAATPDRLVNHAGLLEVKCPANGANHLKHCFITNDEYFKKEHPDYYWQCLSQMMVCERAWCDFVSFDPRINSDLGLFIYRLYANEEEFELLRLKINEATIIFNDYLKIFSSEKN